MSDRRQRLAWFIVLGSFFTCLAFAILIPLSVNAALQGAVRPLAVLVQANEGTVGIQQGDNGTGALFAGEPAQSLSSGGYVLTNATDTALLLVYTPDQEQLVARIQVYGNTNVAVEEATAPRFGVSSADSRLSLTLNSGRLLLVVPPFEDRALSLQLELPHGQVTVKQPGQYSVTTVNAESQFAVLEGEALVSAGGHELVLVTDERVVLPAEGVFRGPLDTERNLIQNSDFGNNFDNWFLKPGEVERADQPRVEVQIAEDAGEPVLKFSRLGMGHADAGVRQVVNQDVSDYQSLNIVISMRILNQSLTVCGGQGSECPLTIRIEYTDVNGVNQVWQQGFYAVGTVGENPDLCVTCGPPLNVHEFIPFNQLAFYESQNLLVILGQLNILPRHIDAIELIASGHTFDVEVVELGLMARE